MKENGQQARFKNGGIVKGFDTTGMKPVLQKSVPPKLEIFIKVSLGESILPPAKSGV